MHILKVIYRGNFREGKIYVSGILGSLNHNAVYHELHLEVIL